MGERPLYVGIDLGTTNSAVAVFDGDQTTIVRNQEGASLTPSVVRIDSHGRVTVGAAARRFLDRDPDNTRAEFKRLMGTDKCMTFAGAQQSRTPVDLAVEVLTALRQDVCDQFQVAPTAAVISVPALFEVPQNAATAMAGRRAGFERVELLQEPIASALAAGWRADEGDGRWLVYDLGGGTFDVSLLETDGGFLRVVGHDGDNFLGGRDFDWAVVDWAVTQIEREHGIVIRRQDPAHGAAVAQLKHMAEDAKIRLSRAGEVVLVASAPLAVPDARPCEPELVLTRDELEHLVTPLVDRTVEVCQRLLQEHRCVREDLARVVFVGGPTVMPLLRRRVAETLGAPIAEGLDPMTLVAQGAAIYGATAGLDARPAGALVRQGCQLWLQYPAVSSDLTPHLIGRVVEAGTGRHPHLVRAVRRDQAWVSSWTQPDEDHGFVIQLELCSRASNRFEIEAVDETGTNVPVHPTGFTVMQGLTITDPPLSRSVGVALASGQVLPYFDRGTPLPARRTFTHHTIESVAQGSSGHVLKIPIVQGEQDRAYLCRLVGSLEIAAASLQRSLPAGSAVEVTLELDRGGRLGARALVPALDQVFEEVAHLLVPDADPLVLRLTLAELGTRVDVLRAEGFRHGITQLVSALERAEDALADVQRDLAAAEGGDHDAGQRARRHILEIDAKLEELEQAKQWPELDERAVTTMTWANRWVAQLGSERERALFEEIGQAVDRARRERDIRDLQRQLRLADQLGETAWYRDPDTWPTLFESAASRAEEASDLPVAMGLVRDGRLACERGDLSSLRLITERLWRLLPHDPVARRKSYDSGVR